MWITLTKKLCRIIFLTYLCTMNDKQKTFDILKYQKGSFISVELERPAKVLKGVTQAIVKQTKMVARLGINYDNMQQTQDKRESGEAPAQNAGLPWGEWDVYPYVIKHKGEKYLRMYADKHQVKTTYLVNGIETPKNELKSILQSSEFKAIDDNTTQLTMTVKADTIKSIG